MDPHAAEADPLFRRKNGSENLGAAQDWADVTHSLIDPMFQIDLPLAAELLVVLFIVATMDGSSPWDPAAEPSVNEPEREEGWSVETDLHAQRILRLERRQAETSANRA